MRAKFWSILIFSFAGIGFVYQLILAPFYTLSMLAIIAAVFYLYKFPPRWLFRLANQRPPSRPKTTLKKKDKRKHYPFQVIDGKKKSRF
jgi:hypothetical protein